MEPLGCAWNQQRLRARSTLLRVSEEEVADIDFAPEGSVCGVCTKRERGQVGWEGNRLVGQVE